MKKNILTILILLSSIIPKFASAEEPYLFLKDYKPEYGDNISYYGKRFKVRRARRKGYLEVRLNFMLKTVYPDQKSQYERTLCLFKIYPKPDEKFIVFAKFGKDDYQEYRNETVGANICYSALLREDTD